MRSEQIVLTVDALITIAGRDVLLIKRAKAPVQDRLVLPGGHVEDGESFVDACVREIEEEVGLQIRADQLKLLTVLDAQDRDPRPGRHVSLVYHIDFPTHEAIADCQAGSDAAEIEVKELSSLTEEMIGFDHFQAIKLVA